MPVSVRRLPCAAGLLALACSSAPAPMPQPTTAPAPAAPVDWAEVVKAAPPVPLITWHGGTYAVAEVRFLQSVEGEGCEPAGPQKACTQPVAYAGPAPEGPLAGATTVHRVGAEAPCAAKLGPLVQLDTRSCEVTVTLARALEGCDGEGLAPLGFLGQPPSGLRWVPRAGQPPAAPDPATPQGAWYLQKLEGDPLTPEAAAKGTPKALRWTLDAGAERLVSHAAGLQIDLGECNADRRTWMDWWLIDAAGQERSLTLPETLLDWTPWQGALVRDGRVSALVGRGPTDTVLFGRAGDTFAEAWRGQHFRDNEECLQASGPVDFELPCAP